MRPIVLALLIGCGGGSGKGGTSGDGDGDGDGDGVPAPEDCDDGDAAVHPGMPEVCDADDIDEDCDGTADDADDDATGQLTVHADDDGDGFGAATATVACDPPPGTVADGTDCDDARVQIHPGAAEVCDADDVDED